MVNKEKIPLMLGLSIPVLMVVILGASIYLPTIGVQPRTNFLYSYGDQFSRTAYYLEANKVVKREVKYPEYYGNRKEAMLFIYDVTTDKSKSITLEQANRMDLDGNLKSPDGFEVATDDSRSYGVFPVFYSHSSYGQKYLRKGNYSKKLTIDPRDGSRPYYYDYGFNFLGWAIKGE